MSEYNMNSESELQESVGEPVTGPGARLRAARERKGLDIKAVADHLHLPERLIQSLERDDYSEIPGTVFVKGYLRNYARLVDEPVDEVVALNSDKRPAEQDYRPVPRSSQMQSSRIKPYRRGTRISIGGMLLWVLALAIVVVLVLWWRGYIDLPAALTGQLPSDGTQRATLPLTPSATEQGDAGSLPVPLTTDLSAGGETSLVDAELAPLQPSAPADEGRSSVFVAGNAAAPGSQPVSSGLESDILPGTDQEQAAEPITLEPERMEPPGSSATTAMAVSDGSEGTSTASDEQASNLELAPVTSGDGVVLEFSAPCWVDIRDAEGNKVLYGGVGGGERHMLTGKPPYRVVLGNNAAVSISVDGRPLDTAKYSTGKVARFNLDPATVIAGVSE